MGNITGTYLHGLLDNHPWRRTWLNDLRSQKKLAPLPPLSGHYRVERDALFDELGLPQGRIPPAGGGNAVSSRTGTGREDYHGGVEPPRDPTRLRSGPAIRLRF